MLVLSRQALPTLDRPSSPRPPASRKGAYVLTDADGGIPDVILIATGSEVSLALSARDELAADGIGARVVSMPCWELFDRQPQSYRDAVLPPSVKARVAVEEASTLGWDRYVGDGGAVVGDAHVRRVGPAQGARPEVRFHPRGGGRRRARSPPVTTPLRERPAWSALEAHYAEIRDLHLRDLFAEDPTRGERLAAEGAGLYLDYSKNRVTDETLAAPRDSSPTSRASPSARTRCSAATGSTSTENRSVLHVALRMPRERSLVVDGVDVVARSTSRSTGWPRSASASARATGRVTPASRSATS